MTESISQRDLISFVKSGRGGALPSYGFAQTIGMGPRPWEALSGVLHFRRGVSSIPLSRSGFTSSAARWPYVEVTVQPIRSVHVPCLRLHLKESEWIAYADMIRIDERPIFYCAVDSQEWINALLGEAEVALKPYLELLPKLPSELRSFFPGRQMGRVNSSYSLRLEDRLLALASSGAMHKLRNKELDSARKFGMEWTQPFPAATRSVRAKKPAAAVKTRSRPIEAAPHGRFPNRTGKRGAADPRCVTDWSVEEVNNWFEQQSTACYQVGGPPVLTTRPTPKLPGKKDEEELLESGLWWWRHVCKWTEPLQQLFHANWKRSAFYYEFRARIGSTIAWRPFEVPWLWLDHYQRAALFHIWPPRPGHPYSLYPLASHGPVGPQPSAKMIEVNLSRPLKAVLEDVTTKWKEAGIELGQMQVAGVLPDAKDESSIDWNLLEEMDRVRFLNQTMANKYVVQRKRRVHFYEDACIRCGIAP